MKKTNNRSGYLLIATLIVLAIIAIWAAMYFSQSGNGGDSTLQTGKRATEQAKQNNDLLQQEQIQVQNELNSIDAR